MLEVGRNMDNKITDVSHGSILVVAPAYQMVNSACVYPLKKALDDPSARSIYGSGMPEGTTGTNWMDYAA